MSGALIVRDDARMAVSFTAEALALKSRALETSALIGRVDSPESQATAVQAQQELQNILSLTEKARKACKEPVLTYGRAIDDAAKQFSDDLKPEMARISELVGSYIQLEQAKARAAENARKAEEARIEAERQAEIARVAAEQAAANRKIQEQQREAARLAAEAKNKEQREKAEALRVEAERHKALSEAQSHNALDKINEHYADRAAALPVAEAPPAKIQGQRVTDDFEVTVTDIHLLYRAHSNCVDLTPRIGEIKALLKMGVQVKGVTAKAIVKATVRAGRQPMAIEV